MVLAGPFAYHHDGLKSVPSLALSNRCEYDVIKEGQPSAPISSLEGIGLGDVETATNGQIQADDRVIKHRGQISHLPQDMREADDDRQYVMSTVSIGDRQSRTIVAGIQTLNSDIRGLPAPTFILKPKKGSSCADQVSVYAEDASAISGSALRHLEVCDHIPNDACGPSLPTTMLATCRIKSNFPKGKALYVIGNKPDQIAFLADWSAMREWRFSPDGYKPANTRKSCPNPF